MLQQNYVFTVHKIRCYVCLKCYQRQYEIKSEMVIQHEFSFFFVIFTRRLIVLNVSKIM